jgi:retron-type reverse transcriptase
LAWKEFKKGKTKKKDVQQFYKNIKENILELHRELRNKTYKHSNYFSFYVSDPKLRHIHKATVKDRVLHHAIFRVLYPVFDKSFIFDSYSCRLGKGTHKAVNRLNQFANKVSKNNSENCFVLKLDIRKFFDSVDQNILLDLIKSKIYDENAIWLIDKIIKSFERGIPLGNITSQLFANVYLNKLDKFIKYKLKIKYYIRYCDDFLILSNDKIYLENLITEIDKFLKNSLKIFLHPNKIVIRKYRQGVDFLGYVSFPHHRILRSKTRKRMLKKINSTNIQSYLGILVYCSGHKIRSKINCLLQRT